MIRLYTVQAYVPDSEEVLAAVEAHKNENQAEDAVKDEIVVGHLPFLTEPILNLP